jgi:hypothetical protein
MFGSRGSRNARFDQKRLRVEALESRIVMSATGIVDAPQLALQPVVQTPAPQLTTEEWVHSLTYPSFNLIPANQVQYLTLQQVASIPHSGYFQQWSAESRAALSTPQVQALNVATIRINLLTQQQISVLTAPQIQSMPPWDLQFLLPAQVSTLTATQISGLTQSFFAEWSPEGRAALTAPQVRSLNMADVSLEQLTTAQKGYLTAAQIQSIPVWEVELLTASQIPYLSAAQVSGLTTPLLTRWTPEMRAALTTSQIPALRIEYVSLTMLTPAQISAMTTAQVRVLPPLDFPRLNPSQIPLLTTAQIASIPDAQFLGWWSPEAIAALTTTQIQSLNVAATGIVSLLSDQRRWLTSDQLHSLKYQDFGYLFPYQVFALTPAQIASIPNTGVLMAWSPEARGAMNWTQIQAMPSYLLNLTLLTPAQIGWMLPAQIQSLTYGNFRYLGPNEASKLTAAQIASIPSIDHFTSWKPETRAALTAGQIRALNTTITRINLLSATQVSWLTTSQIQSLEYYDFRYLRPTQIQYLTIPQVKKITSPGILAEWSASARASLTQAQIQALNFSNLDLNHFTTTQLSWLTTAQIRSLPTYWLFRLNPSQVTQASVDQFAQISSSNALNAMSPDAQNAITLQQMLAVDPAVWAEYSLSIQQPSSYHPAEHMPIGPDGVAQSAHLTVEADRFFALVPHNAATHSTIASGDWSDPRIWSNGVVPGAGAKVVVSTGTTVNFNAFMNTAIKTLRIDGTLSFATHLNTQLKVDTIVVMTAGKLHIGTATNPIQNHVTARVLIADGGPIDTVWDPYKLSRGLLSRGEVRMHGKVVTPYVNAAVDPSFGDTQLILAQVPTNWKVGDRLVVAGSQPISANFGAEERTIRAIQGNVVTIDTLYFDHHTPAGQGQSIQIANLSRNIEFKAEDSSVVAERPHMVFFHNPNVAVDNIGIYGFGRTDKSIAINDPVVVNGVLQPGTGTNPRARYAIHFHHTGVNPTQAPAVVRGSVVDGSPGWGFVNHSSNVNFETNVAYSVKGSAFVTEDGNEIGLMRANLALSSTGTGEKINARAHLHDWGFNGHGFWFQGPGIKVVDNIASGSTSGAFAYFANSSKNLFDTVNLQDPSLAGDHLAVPVEVVPLDRFEGNTAYGARSGLEIWHHRMKANGAPSVIEDFTAWNTRMNGIEVWYSGHIAIRNANLIGNLNAPAATGIVTNRLVQDMTFENVRAVGFQVGIQVPLKGTSVINNGYFAAVQALHIAKGHDTSRRVNITGHITFQPLTAAQLQGRPQYNVYLASEVDMLVTGSSMDPLFAADKIIMAINGGRTQQLFYYNQLKGYIPFPTATTAQYVATQYQQKTNGQLRAAFGKSFGGEMITPSTVVETAGINGLVRYLN